MSQKPDLVIVSGTSLKIPGVIEFIKALSRRKKQRPEIVYVNRECTEDWNDIIDYFLQGESDDFFMWVMQELWLQKIIVFTKLDWMFWNGTRRCEWKRKDKPHQKNGTVATAFDAAFNILVKFRENWKEYVLQNNDEGL